jgi:excalibur calcium-binding domain-containing protein
MKKIALGIVIGAFALVAYQRVHDPDPVPQRAADPMQPGLEFVERPDQSAATSNDSANFRCDGRTHCSQMTSCAEATYFLRNCPGVQMDGEGDGVPCEKQWCGHR